MCVVCGVVCEWECGCAVLWFVCCVCVCGVVCECVCVCGVCVGVCCVYVCMCGVVWVKRECACACVRVLRGQVFGLSWGLWGTFGKTVGRLGLAWCTRRCC